MVERSTVQVMPPFRSPTRRRPAGRPALSRRDGYTIVELMIVVAIVGILSAIAIPSFQSYLYRSRAAEATVFLAEIRQRQESYRAEFGQYCSVSAAAGTTISGGTWAPAAAATSGQVVAWTGAPGDWDQLGATPDGPVRFQYRTTAGSPGQAAGVPGYTGAEFWFVAQARADLDGDGDNVIMEAYSAGSNIFIGDDSMNQLAQGWE